MSWVEWLKGLAERLPGADSGADSGSPGQVRPPRKGGDAYARQWVRVLEDSAPPVDPASTYTWELHTESATGRGRRPAAQGQSASPPAKADPFDTYTWELQEGDSPEDPWGLNKTAPPQAVTRKDGVNPYDTGIFDASWTGRFDQR